MAQESFLKFPLSSIRRSIKDIDDSYRNPWDIFAELAQNSVDAIVRMQRNCDEVGKIVIQVDSQEKKIIFEDNGCGISYDDLPELLNLFSSGKSEEPSSVGEKGVGLKFVMFQSKEFEIVSSDGVTAGRAVVKDARLWKKSTSDNELLLDREELADIKRGTRITLRGIELDRDDQEEQTISLFHLTFDQLKYILRNKTYLGSTISLWENNIKSIHISLKYKDTNGIEYEEVLKNEYILPIEGISKTDIVDMDEFEKWLATKDRSDTEKRNKLQGKILVKKGTYLHKNYRQISYWVCFLPTRRDWAYINQKLRLIHEGQEINEELLESNGYCLYYSGIFTATKGMPTGISIKPPNTGGAGYWSNFFMLFQDNALTFDIGRKSIHGKVQAIYQQKAKEIFNSITKYVTKYTSAIPVKQDMTSDFDKDDIRDTVRSMMDLGTDKISFEKIPSEQEAAVAAIFYEMVGREIIADIKPIYTGYRNRYDLYAYYISPYSGKKKFGFYEFKSHLRHLTKDFSDATKVFDELDYVICWDVNDADIQDLYKFGITCEEIESSSLHALDCPKAVSHRMSIPNCNPVYVIDLKKLI